MMCPRCGSESVQENAAACDDSSLSCKICEKCGHRWQGSDWFGCLFEEKSEEQKEITVNRSNINEDKCR